MEKKRFIDIHSHIIFGADDGVSSLGEAVKVLKQDRDEGATAVFATPHFGRENIFEPDAAMVRRNFEMLKERAAEEVPEIRLYLGTEWYCARDLADRVRRRDAFRMNDTDYVLAEFLEFGGVYESWEKISGNLLELQKRGFRPILAHAERYKALQEDRERLRELHDNGILLQVNAFDLELNSSARTRGLAQWLAQERMISFIGSDMHGLPPKRTPKMKEGLWWLYEHTDEEYADAVAFDNAEKLLIRRENTGNDDLVNAGNTACFDSVRIGG